MVAQNFRQEHGQSQILPETKFMGWGVTCMDMPERLTVNGVRYVREDAVPQPRALERSYTAAEIESLTGVSSQSVYRAVRSGRLHAVYPNGSSRGMRITESEYLRWIGTCESS